MSQQKIVKTRYIAFAAVSIDGKIALTSHTRPTWTSREDWVWFQKSLASMDAVVVGRKTYQAAKSRLDKRQTFVLTSKVRKLVNRGSVTFINPSSVSLARLLGKHKRVGIVGGRRVYGSMIDAGLCHEIYITVEPLVFGSGIGMIDRLKQDPVRYTLISARRLNSKGSLLLHYKLSKL